MLSEHNAQMKQSESLHKAQIDRLEQDHLKYKDEMRIKNSGELQEVRHNIINEAKERSH